MWSWKFIDSFTPLSHHNIVVCNIVSPLEFNERVCWATLFLVAYSLHWSRGYWLAIFPPFDPCQGLYRTATSSVSVRFVIELLQTLLACLWGPIRSHYDIMRLLLVCINKELRFRRMQSTRNPILITVYRLLSISSTTNCISSTRAR